MELSPELKAKLAAAIAEYHTGPVKLPENIWNGFTIAWAKPGYAPVIQYLDKVIAAGRMDILIDGAFATEQMDILIAGAFTTEQMDKLIDGAAATGRMDKLISGASAANQMGKLKKLLD